MTHPEIEQAIADKRVLRFAYFGEANGLRYRTVSPYEIVVGREGRANLLAWDHEREGLRAFRIAGISEGATAPETAYVEPVTA